MRQWWGPNGFKVLASKMDLRPGGAYHYGMKTPNGQSMWGKFLYREIVPKNGCYSSIRPSLRAITGPPSFGTHAVGLVPIAPQMLAGMEAGWSQSIDKIQELMAATANVPRTQRSA